MLHDAKQADYKPGVFDAYRHLAFNYGVLQSDFGKAFQVNAEAKQVALEEDNPKHLGDVYVTEAILNHASGKLDSAAFYYVSALDILENLKDTAALLPIYNNISNLYSLMANDSLAISN